MMPYPESENDEWLDEEWDGFHDRDLDEHGDDADDRFFGSLYPQHDNTFSV